MIRIFKTPTSLIRLYPKRIWGFNSSENIYLTFDDGPTELTSWVLDELKSRGIKATFFCVGSNVKKNPTLFERIKLEGHSIGNHTMNHEMGWKVPKKKYLASVEEADELIKSSLFRPPYGKMSRSFEKALINKYKIVMWSWLSYDFDSKVDINMIMEKAHQIKKGDVLVLHDNEKCTERVKELLPQLLDYLTKKGFKFAPISV